MPVTARLSKQLYDRLGEAVTNELVDWLNQVDTAYRSDLRELNEANFARFDAKLEQRLAELRGELKADIAALRSELKADIAGSRGELKAEMACLRGELKTEVGSLRADFAYLENRFEARLQSAMREQMKFFVAAWATMLVTLGVPIVGLWFR